MADYKLANGAVSTAQSPGANRGGIGATTHQKQIIPAHTEGPGKSRKSNKDVRVDGNGDDASDIDHDLTLAELELQLLGDGHGLSTDRNGGGGSFKSFGAGQSGLHSSMSDNDKSRGRPIKLHEKEPFLTVGASPSQEGKSPQLKTGGSEPSLRLKSGILKTHRSQATPSSNGPLTSYFRSPYSSPSPSLGGLSGRRTPSRMYVSPNTGTPRQNPCIKTPFKHSIKKPPATEPRATSPSQELKEMTALATYHVTRILAASGSRDKRRNNGRLLKGRLKPLNPVSVSGPSIRQCRGIIADSRSYSPSASRTLQRRRQIMMQLKSGHIDPHRPAMHPHGGSDSAHRVSAASSVEDLTNSDRDLRNGARDLTNGEEGLTNGEEELTNGEADLMNGEREEAEEEVSPGADREFETELAAMEKDAVSSQKMEDTSSYMEAPRGSLSGEATVSVPDKPEAVSRKNTTLGPQSVMSHDQGLVDRQIPDFSTPAPPPMGQGGEVTPSGDRFFMTQSPQKMQHVMQQAEADSQENGKVRRSKLSTDKTQNNASSRRASQNGIALPMSEHEINSSNVCVNNANNNFLSDGLYRKQDTYIRRPMSASVHFEDSDVIKPRERERPKTAGAMKAVRFAEHTQVSDGSEIPLSVSASWIRENQQKRKGQEEEKLKAEERRKKEEEEKEVTRTSQSSCKPVDSNVKSPRKDEDNDDGKTGGGTENHPPATGRGTLSTSKPAQSEDGGNKNDRGKKNGSTKDSGAKDSNVEDLTVEDSSEEDTCASKGSTEDGGLYDASTGDENTKSSITSLAQERTVSQNSLALSSLSVMDGRVTRASVLSLQGIRLSDVESRQEMGSEVAFISPSPSSSTGTPTPATTITPILHAKSQTSMPNADSSFVVGKGMQDSRKPTPSTKQRPSSPLAKAQVLWAENLGVAEGPGRERRIMVPDGASLFKLLLEVGSISGEPSLSLSHSSVTHLTEGSASLRGSKSDVTTSQSGSTAENLSGATGDSVASGSTTTQSDFTITNSDISLPNSITTAGCVTGDAKKSVMPHAPCTSSRRYDTLSARVGVVFCKHDETYDHSQVKQSHGSSPRSQKIKEVGGEEEKKNTDIVSPRQQRARSPVSPRKQPARSPERTSPERKTLGPSGVDNKLKTHGSNTMSDMYTHFSLGFEISGCYPRTEKTVSFISRSDKDTSKDESVRDDSSDTSKPKAIHGILKKRTPTSPSGSPRVESPRGLRAYLMSRLQNRPDNRQYSMLAAELGHVGEAQQQFEPSKDAQAEQSHDKPKVQKRMRQTFTHLSNQPFIYPSDDPFSSGVAMRLKFGDSPYLKEIKLPKRPLHPRRVPIVPKHLDANFHAEDVVAGHLAPVSPRALQKTQLMGPRKCVQFADFTMEPLNLNQNCVRTDFESGTHDWIHVRESPHATPTLILQHTGVRLEDQDEAGDGSVALSRPTDTDHRLLQSDVGSSVDPCGDTYDLDARFCALEEALSAVRWEIQDKIVDSHSNENYNNNALLHDDPEYALLYNNDTEYENEYNDDDGFVYEDDGSSDEDQQENDNKLDAFTGDQEQGVNLEEEEDVKEEDALDEYNEYYRELLLAYRQKCMMAGEGSLVISDRLTWPYASDPPTDSTTTGSSLRHHRRRSLQASPDTAKPFRAATNKDALVSRPESRYDSGLESDSQSDFGGCVFQRSNSLASTDGDSVLSSCSNSSTPTPGELGSSKRNEATAKGKETEICMQKNCEKLEIIASSVLKSKTRHTASSGMAFAPVAPFPPLCFAVNARPPPDSVFYFAYATYMNPDRLGSLLKRQVSKRYWAVLFGFDLAFNRKGSDEECGGFANIVFNPFASVEGCVFQLTPSELDQLDAFTNSPEHYTRVVLPVWMSEVSGLQTDLDLAKYCVPAITYIAQNDYTLRGSSRPNDFELSQCLKSADILTPAYCDHLRSFRDTTAVSTPQPTAS